MNLRYVLFPGDIVDPATGQTQYVDAPALAKLWGIPFSQCVISIPGSSFAQDRRLGDIELHPCADGRYNHVPEPVSA